MQVHIPLKVHELEDDPSEEHPHSKQNKIYLLCLKFNNHFVNLLNGISLNISG